MRTYDRAVRDMRREHVCRRCLPPLVFALLALSLLIAMLAVRHAQMNEAREQKG